MRKKMLAGNWKMNKLNADLAAFFAAFGQALESAGAADATQRVDVLFAVPFTLLERAIAVAAPWGIRIAAQNFHAEPAGAFTGEVSVPMLKEIGVTTSLVGHSERRQFFGESDASVARKTKVAQEQNLMPIVCLGETLDEREAGQTEAVVRRQLATVLEAMPPMAATTSPGFVIAYEPIWAIGTGRSASSQQAEEVHRFIRSQLALRLGAPAGEQIRILYGGSATPANIAELLVQPDIDGGLVGGASLKPEDFARMVLAAL
jgi:triosephosphate isomerase